MSKELKSHTNKTKKQLNFELFISKMLIKMNNNLVNFIISYLLILMPTFFLYGLNFLFFVILTSLHYLFVWSYLVKKHNFKLINDEEKNDLEENIKSIKTILKEKK
jgi:hypothetical protein